MAIKELQQPAAGIYARVQSLLDRIVSRDTREHFSNGVISFANEQPYLASFIFFQLLLSFTPLALFLSFAIATILFSFITALIFSLFWVGAALFVLIPTLFATVSLGIAVWIWAVSSFLVARWAYSLIPVSVKGGLEVGIPNGNTVVVSKTGEGYGDVDANVNPATS